MPELITEPGVYDLPVEEYHADPVSGGSLSSSGARRLLPPGCPAAFQYWRTHPQPPSRAFDFGHAAHKVVLGEGAALEIVDADNWKTKAAREQRDEAYTEGRIPLLAGEHEVVLEMAEVLRAHPIAGALFAPGSGKPEQTLVWQDGPVWRRALLDWLPEHRGGRLIIPDYKTCDSADPETLQRAIARYGYHQQADWYSDGVRALGLAVDPAFVFVFQEKTPPYLVTVAEPDAASMRIARFLNRQAIDLYAECVANERWPGYSDDVELIPLPVYIENRYREDVTL